MIIVVNTMTYPTINIEELPAAMRSHPKVRVSEGTLLFSGVYNRFGDIPPPIDFNEAVKCLPSDTTVTLIGEKVMYGIAVNGTHMHDDPETFPFNVYVWFDHTNQCWMTFGTKHSPISHSVDAFASLPTGRVVRD